MPKAAKLDREATISPTAIPKISESFVPHRYRLTVAEYHRLGEMAIFDEDSRVKLIAGDLIAMPPIGERHAGKIR